MVFQQERESESWSAAVEGDSGVMRRLEIQCHCLGTASCDCSPLALLQHSRKISCLPCVLFVPVFIPWNTRAIKSLVHKRSPNTHIYHLQGKERAIFLLEGVHPSHKSLCEQVQYSQETNTFPSVIVLPASSLQTCLCVPPH